ncbi:hypothetical protein H7K13_23830 [Priestia aryabhattai]|uniref:hypothetical protein n=1 Tax=Priestia aryabhattai TaxID=412384 RepID=UPI001C8DD7B3|nr:hypothetical protein [Priestia aryabhattai]MBY0077960.1 hypothetical protein [Priestia aryabhattai]
MGKPNRGNVTKLSIRLTEKAHKEVQRYGMMMNLSKAGVILFALAKILKENPTRTTVLNLEQKYTLEPTNFAMTIKKELADKLADLTVEMDMNKNIWIGLLVSHYFESGKEAEVEEKSDPEFVAEIDRKLALDPPDTSTDVFKIKVETNTELKKKIVEFSEENYIPLSGLVTYALLKGPSETLPEYQEFETDYFFTRIPVTVYEQVKQKADEMYLSDFKYMQLCLYNAFMGKDKVFDL